MNKNMTVVFVLMLTAGCTSSREYAANYAPPMDSSRKVAEQDCARPVDSADGNLMCRQVSQDERRAKMAEEERQARERKEAQERAAREAAERERAEQLAREEAARKAQAAEQERLAAAAALKAQEERDRLAKAEADARAAREAAERECRRIAQEQLDGRAVLTNFVTNYGKVGEFKGMAGQISTFLNKAPTAKPCP